MACKIPNSEQLKNLIDNHKALFDIKPNQTQEDTIKYLETLQNNFVKKDGKYTLKDTPASVKDTVTGRIGKWWEKKNPILPSAEQRAIVNQKAEIGNFIHDVNELVGNAVYQRIKDLTPEEYFKLSMDISEFDIEDSLKNIESFYGYTISRTQLINMFKGIREVFSQIYGRQKAINLRTGKEGKPYIVFEQILIDPQEDVGGTADLVAIYSDNTASVFDFKTKIPRKDQIDKKTGKLREDKKFLGYLDEKRYTMQLAALSKILKRKLGVQRVVSAPIHFIKVTVPWDMIKKGYGKNITGIAHGQKQDNVLQQFRPLSETTGFQDLDAFLANIDKRLKIFEEKSKKDKDNRKYYLDKMAELSQAKRDILANKNFDNILRYAKKLDTELTDGYVASLSLDELKFKIDELKTLASLADSTYEYRTFMLKEGKTDKDSVDKFKADVGILYSELQDKINMLEEILFDQKTVALIEEVSGLKITDDSGRILPFNDEGFFGKYFNQLSQFENPIFKTFRSLLDKAQYDTKHDIDKVIDDVQKTEDALYKWMKENGKDRKWFVETFIDLTTDNLVSKLDKDFVNVLKKVKTEKNVSEIIKYYEPKELYNEWYNEKLSEIKDSKKRAEFIKANNLDVAGKNSEAWITALYQNKLKLKSNIESKNLGNKYSYIQSVPELANYYNMFVKWNSEFRDMLHVEYFNLPNNFIPNIRKTTVERIQDLGLIGGLKQSITNMIDDLNVREDDMFYGELEDGRLSRKIPRFFINPFKDGDNILIGEKSYELGKSLILFAKMAYNYKHMNEIEAKTVALREFMLERGEELIRKRGKQVEDYVGNKLTTAIGTSDLQKIFDSFVDMYLYGISIQPTIGDKSGDWEKRILAAKQYFSMKSLGLGFIPAAGSFVAAKINATIEGQKGVVYTAKQYKESLTEAWKNREKYLAFSAYFDPMGHFHENFSVTETKLSDRHFGKASERSNIGKYINSRILLRPFAAGDEFIDEQILAAMGKNYYVDDLGNLKRMKNDSERDLYSNRSVWELFNYDKDSGDASINIPEEQLAQVFIDFKRAAQAVQSKIKGTIPQEDKAYWQSQIVGQVLMHFKSWMPGIIKERFGELRYNSAIQAIDIGKYKALGSEFANEEQLATIDYMRQVLPKKLLDFVKHLLFLGKLGKMNDKYSKQYYFEQWLEQNPHYKDKVTYEEFEDIQQRQLKSLMIELRVLLTFAALIALMGMRGDDGEKYYRKYFLTRKLAAVLFKTNQEVSFTYNPVEFSKMIANPMPMIGLFTDATKVISNGFDEWRDLLVGENNKSDKTDIFYYSSKFIPGGNQLIKFLDIFNSDSGESYK